MCMFFCKQLMRFYILLNQLTLLFIFMHQLIMFVVILSNQLIFIRFAENWKVELMLNICFWFNEMKMVEDSSHIYKIS